MPDRFMPLREFVFRASAEPVVQAEEPVAAVEVDETLLQTRDALGEIRRFHAAVRDAVDAAVNTLLCDIAADVLARELELAPANIEAILSRACARYAREEIVRVRVHPDEATQVSYTGVAVIADSDVRRGDVMLEVCSGTIDVSLGARLAHVLERATS